VPGAKQKPRFLLGIDELDRLKEDGDATFRISRVMVDGRQVDQRPASPVPLIALEKERDRPPQKLEGLLETPLFPPKRGFKVEEDGALQRVLGAPTKMLVRRAEDLVRPLKIAAQPVRVADVTPRSCPQILEERLAIELSVEVIGKP